MRLLAVPGSFQSVGLRRSTMGDVSEESISGERRSTYTCTLQVFGNHICCLLLIDEHDNRRGVLVAVEDLQ